MKRIIAGVALLVVLVGVVVYVRHGDDGGLARTRAALMDDGSFVNGPTAGLTFAKASEWLLDDGAACEERRGKDDARCRARLSAAAYSGVAAFVVAECTAQGVFEARAAMLDYVGRLQTFDRRRPTTPAPEPPAVPTC